MNLNQDECKALLACIDGAMHQGVNGIGGAASLVGLADKLARHAKFLQTNPDNPEALSLEEVPTPKEELSPNLDS
jgi:hypothetical protein